MNRLAELQRLSREHNRLAELQRLSREHSDALSEDHRILLAEIERLENLEEEEPPKRCDVCGALWTPSHAKTWPYCGW